MTKHSLAGREESEDVRLEIPEVSLAFIELQIRVCVYGVLNGEFPKRATSAHSNRPDDLMSLKRQADALSDQLLKEVQLSPLLANPRNAYKYYAALTRAVLSEERALRYAEDSLRASCATNRAYWAAQNASLLRGIVQACLLRALSRVIAHAELKPFLFQPLANPSRTVARCSTYLRAYSRPNQLMTRECRFPSLDAEDSSLDANRSSSERQATSV